MRPPIKKSIKLDDVASLAGVSPSTVSLYVRRPDKVSANTGTKIQQAIDELGYVHNKIASQLTGGRSQSMALLVPSIANIAFSEAIQQIEKQLSQANYTLSIATYDHDLDKEEEQIRSILAWKPAAIAITGATHKPNTIKMLKASGIPVVQMFQVDRGDFTAQVGINHTKAGYAAADYLLETGCKKPAYFSTRLEDDVRAKKRCNGFIAALEEHNIEPVVVDIAGNENIYAATRPALLRAMVANRGIDGIFASNDSIATALLMEANDKGIKVPEQLSILGFGDFPYSGYLSPVSLSSMSLHAKQVARHSAEMMLRMAQDESYEGERIDVGFEIIPRQSTRLPAI
ncbi:LacI family DNA-binding transcriptional regulator [Ferrimonas lipolytica]|uniref:LacI family transcriptional regulator n=1 Tax=Ferrimonas lipolytica TaxID=2724191 RepID=A0A6H1UEH5_9GAMM|nr:LacI family DNA-binding transcriptional regulator [Ferrimonas lipolytica]QIZ77495.1 LacI family transcriptional regulator [Ferrimonas lipolytica]